MDNSITTEMIWVDTPGALAKMLRNLEACNFLAVDTESNSLFAYQEQVCLIQFSTGREDYLVDPLALDDLSSLGSIFSSPIIEKIFHAAEYDIICLRRDFGFSFENIFDTMLAGRILKYPQIGLAAMLESEFNLTLDKRFQRANWGERPLSEEQKAYARLDTHYLIDLRHRLNEQLVEKNLSELAREDFVRMTKVHANYVENGLAHFWRLALKEELDYQQLAVLYELYQYRERVARAKNKPVFKILGDKVLLEIAHKTPRNRDMLEHVPGMNRRMVGMHGSEILIAVEKGMNRKPPPRPCRLRPNERYLNLHEALQVWRRERARELGIESDIVLPRDVMELIAKEEPSSLTQLEKIMQDLPWRFNHYGKEILEIIQQEDLS